MGRDDEDTPLAKPRRSSAALSVWGTVQAWLAADPGRRIAHRVTEHGHEVGAWDSSRTTAAKWELVRPDEDPSAAAMRAIAALSST